MAGLARSDPGKGAVSFIVATMFYLFICMTVQTTHRGGGHDDVVDRGEGNADINGTRGVMAQATITLVQSQDAFRSRPAVDKQRISGSKSSAFMAGITCRATGKISAPHQYVMGVGAVLLMTAKVSAVTGNTLVVAGMARGTSLQGAIRRGVVASLTIVCGMHLTRADEGGRCSAVTPTTVGSGWRGSHVGRHLGGMVMGMTIKIAAMTGLTASPLSLASCTTDASSSGRAVTGLATKTGMSLPRCYIGGRGRRSVAADAQRHGDHIVAMLMTVEIGAVTGRTGSPGGLATGTAGQQTIAAAVTCCAAKGGVGLTASHVRRRCRCMAVQAQGYRGQRMTMCMCGEVGAVAGLTSTTR